MRRTTLIAAAALLLGPVTSGWERAGVRVGGTGRQGRMWASVKQSEGCGENR
jgi:hypothetical protein